MISRKTVAVFIINMLLGNVVIFLLDKGSFESAPHCVFSIVATVLLLPSRGLVRGFRSRFAAGIAIAL